MQFAASQSDLILFAAGLLAAGTIGGLIAGLLGVGGGIVIVPVLYHMLSSLGLDPGLGMHISVATSLATIIPTAISSVRAHDKRGTVDRALLRAWAPPMIAGTVMGTLLAGMVSGRVLALVFGCVALPVAANMAFGREDWRLGDHLPTGLAGSAIAATIGFLSSMMGIGGGTLGVPVMNLYNFPIHRAVGTAAAFGVIISIPAAIGMAMASWHVHGLPPFSLGYVNLLGFILIAPVSVFMAPIGARLAHSLDRRRLRLVFALFIAITAAKMLANALG